MPSYRGEGWIDASLASLAAEAADTTGIEILLIDGSPTAATLDRARAFSHRLNLRTFERADLSSWQAKTNAGVEEARSSHLCWLGVDDLWLPGRAAAVRRWIDAAPDAALHLAPSAIIDAAARVLGVWRCPLPSGRELPRRLLIERLLVQNFIAAPTPVFRKDVWLSCGGLDEALWYTADWDMWLKLAARGTTLYHDEITVGFRIHGDSLTTAGSRDPAAFARQMHIVLERHVAALDGNSADVERIARVSIEVNAALAVGAMGDYSGLPAAALAVLRLGPSGIRRYLRDSRLTERLVPRIRAKLSGRL